MTTHSIELTLQRLVAVLGGQLGEDATADEVTAFVARVWDDLDLSAKELQVLALDGLAACLRSYVDQPEEFSDARNVEWRSQS